MDVAMIPPIPSCDRSPGSRASTSFLLLSRRLILSIRGLSTFPSDIFSIGQIPGLCGGGGAGGEASVLERGVTDRSDFLGP